MWPFIVTGLVTGAVYGLAAVGLVVTYKTSGVFNFAHGALATVAAYLFYVLHVQHGMPWTAAVIVTLLSTSVVLGLCLERLARPLARASLAMQVTATVGLILIVQSAALLYFGVEEPRSVPVFLGSDLVDLGGTQVKGADIVTFVVSLAATGVLYLVFRYTRRGLAMRAVVDAPDLLDLAGTSPVATRRTAWLIGTFLASASGILFATLLPLDPTLLTLLVVQAFGAAALGGFSSLPVTFGGGLAIGVLASLCTKWFTDGVLAGLPPALPFLVLFVVLLVFPRRYLTETSRVLPVARGTWTAPPRMQATAGVALLAALALVPSFAGVHLADWTTAIGTAVILLGLGQLVRESGQVSLAHVAFGAIGATQLSHLTDLGVPWFAALLLAGLIAIPVGALLAIPAIRLSGLYLALATFGFGVALSYMLYTQPLMFGNTGSPVDVPRPGAFSSDNAYYRLVLAFGALAAVSVAVLNRARLGRLLRGLGQSDVALSTSGVNVAVTRLLVFALSAFLASVGGGLVAAGQQTAQATDYPPLLSLTYLALVMIAPGRAPWYAISGALALVLVPSYVDGENVATWTTLFFGVAAVLYAAVPSAFEPPERVRRVLDRLGRRTAEVPGPPNGVAAPSPERATPGALEVVDVTVAFGGVVAVDSQRLTAPTGRITGLIGPNGAGKTTTFNACSGLLAPRSGAVVLDGRDVTGLGPAARARLGLGRTFQRMELFEALTVRENVLAGAEGPDAGTLPWKHVAASRSEKRAAAVAVSDALELCGINALAERPAASLSTGQRRLVELARCLAGPFRILLLDEPSSGLDREETARFGQTLRRVVDERGVGILLVEHDMSLVLGVCDHIHVMDFGHPIYDGVPDDVVAAPVVRAAYLGDVDVEVPAPAAPAAVDQGVRR